MTYFIVSSSQVRLRGRNVIDQLPRKNGRKDYIETMNRWDRVWKWSPAKVAPAIKLLPNYVTDPDFRYKLEALRNGYNKECLMREVMNHQRFVFEAID